MCRCNILQKYQDMIIIEKINNYDNSKYTKIEAGFQKLSIIHQSFILFELKESILTLGLNELAIVLRSLIDIQKTILKISQFTLILDGQLVIYNY